MVATGRNSPMCSKVLYKVKKSLTLVISRCCFAEDGEEMYQNSKRTYRAIVFSHQTYCFVAFSLSGRCRRCLSSLILRIK